MTEATPPMTGRVVVVTGATSGIGKVTAHALAAQGARVVLAVRDTQRGHTVREEITTASPGAEVDVARLDLAQLADVRRFAEEIHRTHPRIHVLVNNAGLHTARREETVDGLESTFAVNHLGHYLLTRLLLDTLDASAPSRVVTVASEAHRGGWIDFDDLQGKRRWSGIKAYTQSKLANIMFAQALARRLDPARTTSNALHPGTVRTGWARGPESGLLRWAVAAASPFLISPERGARTSIHLASSPEVAGITGGYFVRRKPATPSRAARDVAAQERLWQESARLCDLPPT